MKYLFSFNESTHKLDDIWIKNYDVSIYRAILWFLSVIIVFSYYNIHLLQLLYTTWDAQDPL